MSNLYIYPLYQNEIRSVIKNGLKSAGMLKEFKRRAWQDWFIELLSSGELIHDLSTSLVFNEEEWFKNPVCFCPKSETFIQTLLKTGFEGQLSSLRLPCPYFTLAIPKAARFGGETVRGLFVNCITAAEQEASVSRFISRYSVKPTTFVHESTVDRDVPLLTIAYQVSGSEARYVFRKTVPELNAVLQSKTIEEYKSFLAVDMQVVSFDLNKDELKTQFEIARFVIAMIIYLNAFPDSVEAVSNQRWDAAKGKLTVKMMTARDFTGEGKLQPHFRNLRDERFYRNDWAAWQKGSRWVPVGFADYDVNAPPGRLP